jgi:hypothetical protein
VVTINKWCGSLPIAVLFLAFCASPARADFITVLSVNQTLDSASGLFRYEYTLINETTSDHFVTSWVLGVASNANLQLVSGPSDWDLLYSPGDTSITWEVSFGFVGTELSPGNQAVFSFESALGPVFKNYFIVGVDNTGQDLATNQGQISAPGASVTAVPEPSSFVLMGLGVGILSLLGYPRRVAWRAESKAGRHV